MRFRPLGQSQISASVVAHGCWAIGGAMWGGTEENRSIRAIHASIDAGINFIDTAPIYGQGVSEDFVGKAIQGKRDKVVLATKCGLVWDVEKGLFFFERDGIRIYKYLGAESIRHELELSLARLRTDYVDLYQTHWQEPTTPITETMQTLLDLKAEGKIRAIGVCNASIDHMDQYRAVGALDSSQEKYSMLDRGLETEHLPYCLENNIAVLAYSPLALGLLTGKIGPERTFPTTDLRHTNPRFSQESRAQIQEMMAPMVPIAESHGVTLGQLVIAWTIAQPGLTHALVGARDEAQATENAAAADIELSPAELATITSAIFAPA